MFPPRRKPSQTKKQYFRLGGKAENRKNSVSAAAETFLDKKTTFPPGRKSRKSKKQCFRRGGNLPRQKNNISARAEEQKIEKQRFRRGGNAFLLIIQNILIANRWTLLVGRAANNKAHAERQMEELRKEFAP
ncbi:hypothetical protein AS203_04335 [Hoylesella enoeca]|uniref:Uncharacterized protein n=1 Tax=Hoylesella enoeca TaxID=76123 RepID=A0A0S2KK15_9BACT|nr:hypothetical protein AS203_04335 [Hoylesella enoeca]